jgi:RNA polymerase sigma-70 factor (ECF subfamily)
VDAHARLEDIVALGLEPAAERTETEARGVVERARSGDREAFGQLMGAHERNVLRTARALLGNREDALDAAQEAFLRVFRHLHRFDTHRAFAPWLYRIVVNVCRDVHRRRARMATVPLDDLDSAVLARPGDQEANADAADRVRAIRRALEPLSVREREVVVLRDIEGFSTAEVARALGCMEITVRSHLSRGRGKVQATLLPQGGQGR